MSNQVYEIITERIIAELQKGVVPWHKPWKSSGPMNLVSKRAYRGVNTWLLGVSQYASPYWLTFKQAKALGGSVRAGQKATPVVFWKPVKSKDKTSGEEKTFPLLRYYSVFNVEQCDGLEKHIPVDVAKTVAPIDAAAAIVEGMPDKPTIQHGGTRACYAPGSDTVTMPPRDTFDNGEFYYSTLFHELTHATGHVSRLDRKGITESAGFGSETYSKEELVAELGAAFLCAEAGIVERLIDNSAAYINNWLGALKQDVKLVVQAAAQAQKAADYILNRKPAEAPAAPAATAEEND